ncbi:hypothetical protein M6B38_238690 [Iris pallida]|uniref:Uncharacterized protein n=1 Tax=Iris pallida TaxID=29817 RepID=A0AAX6DLK0_IRIPA|nr:hypothetical protein M6B38_238690 [Iris pallida]
MTVGLSNIDLAWMKTECLDLLRCQPQRRRSCLMRAQPQPRTCVAPTRTITPRERWYGDSYSGSDWYSPGVATRMLRLVV